MHDVLGIINLVGYNYPLAELTQRRPLGTVPFGGRYRLMDFALSGLVNSGVQTVGILAPLQHRSLLDHVRSGKDWQLPSKKDGLQLLLPSYEHLQGEAFYEVAGLSANREFFDKSSQSLVLILPGGVVGNFSFTEAVSAHRQTAADITLLYTRQEEALCSCNTHVALDLKPDGNINRIHQQPCEGPGENRFWGALLINKRLLMELIEECQASGWGSLLEVIAAKLGQLTIGSYRYTGFIDRIHCVQSYYQSMMRLLQPEIWRQVFLQPGPIHTKVCNESPTKYGSQAAVTQAIVAGGCSIKGMVDHSILFRGVQIGSGALVRRSILMPHTQVADNVVLEYVICDKNVRVTAGKTLRGDPNHPLVLPKGTVI